MLDTNIVIYVIKRRPLAALQLFNAHAVHMALAIPWPLADDPPQLSVKDQADVLLLNSQVFNGVI